MQKANNSKKRLTAFFLTIAVCLSTIIAVYAGQVKNNNYVLTGIGQCCGEFYENTYHVWVNTTANKKIAQLYYDVSTYRNYVKVDRHYKFTYNTEYCQDNLYIPVGNTDGWQYYEVSSYHASSDPSLGNLATTDYDSSFE